jgi:hypothetical protein
MHRRLHFPSLRQLRAFEAVARSKSIGVGAKELGLSQRCYVADKQGRWPANTLPKGSPVFDIRCCGRRATHASPLRIVFQSIRHFRSVEV